jgi:hypothetical protein
MATSPETASKRPRGRPPVFSDEALRQAASFSYARRVRTRRGAQDLVYRMFAVAAIELFREAHSEKAAPLDWLLKPRRHTLLSELGRVAEPRSDARGALRWTEQDVSRLIRAALQVADAKPATKEGVAMIRTIRRSSRGVSSP